MVTDHSPGSWKEFQETMKVFLFLRLPSCIKALLVTSDRKPSKTTLSSYLMIFMGAHHQQVNQSTSKIREGAPGTRAFSSGSRTWDHNTVRSFLLSIHLISASLCFSLYCWLNYFLLQKNFLHMALNVAPVSLNLAQKKKSFLFPMSLCQSQGKIPIAPALIKCWLFWPRLAESISKKQDLIGQEKIMLLQYISKARNQTFFPIFIYWAPP